MGAVGRGDKTGPGIRRLTGLIGGPLLCIALLSSAAPPGLQTAAWHVAAIAALMAVWWICEAVPIAVTALLPILLFPLLGVAPVAETTAPYANPLIFLFLGGFIIALALERWNLHRRIALTVLAAAGTRADKLIGGFMLATAVLSMWVSNTATTVMMLPIGTSVVGLIHRDGEEAHERPFAVALMLAIAYAASIGGLGTLIGTPPNALLAAFMWERHGLQIGFVQWMLFGVPVAAIMLLGAWVLLTRVLFRPDLPAVSGAQDLIRSELRAMGPLGKAERRVALIFAATALLWVFRPLLPPWLPLSDPAIALIGAVATFVVPADLRAGTFLMDWTHTRRLPWGILILFGGGLALAEGIDRSGLAGWIGTMLTHAQGWPTFLLVAVATTVIVFLTEITSNTATASVFLPVVATFAVMTGHDALLFAAPAALAASCAFMMPVATPPNAIVFGSGMVTIPQMARAGSLLNLIAVAVVTLSAYSLLLWVFGIGLGAAR